MLYFIVKSMISNYSNNHPVVKVVSIYSIIHSDWRMMIIDRSKKDLSSIP
jgi:hypothetical protein